MNSRNQLKTTKVKPKIVPKNTENRLTYIEVAKAHTLHIKTRTLLSISSIASSTFLLTLVLLPTVNGLGQIVAFHIFTKLGLL
jgi:hypothetical protein